MAILFDTFYRPIQYWERIGSLTGTYTGEGLVVKRVFDTPWSTRWIFCRKMLGYHFLDVNSAQKTYVHRIVPDRYIPTNVEDYSNGTTFKEMYVDSLEQIEPIRPESWDAVNKEGVNSLARCTFTYRYPNYAVLTDKEIEDYLAIAPDVQYGRLVSDVVRPSTVTSYYNELEDGTADPEPYYQNITSTKAAVVKRYISKAVQPTAQHIVLPYGMMRFVDGTVKTYNDTNFVTRTVYGTKATNITTKLVAKSEVIYTWHNVPTSDITGSSQVKRIQRFIGCVNKYTFDDYLPQTLLLTAVNSRPFRQLGGHYTTDIEMRMTYFYVAESYSNGVPFSNGDTAIGHNYFLRFAPEAEKFQPQWVDTGYRYDLLTHNGLKTGKRLFEPKDFFEMFLST